MKIQWSLGLISMCQDRFWAADNVKSQRLYTFPKYPSLPNYLSLFSAHPAVQLHRNV